MAPGQRRPRLLPAEAGERGSSSGEEEILGAGPRLPSLTAMGRGSEEEEIPVAGLGFPPLPAVEI